jgi:uncharacterized membrane protein HdeD (DUF308 family)
MDTPEAILADLFGRHWWVLVLRGLAAVLFGLLAFIWPGITLFALVCLFAAFALINGVLSFALAAKAPKGYPYRASLIMGGALGIAAGIITFFWPGLTALGLLILIAAWAIVNGVLEIYLAVKLRKVIQGEWLLGLAGVLSIIFGVLLVLYPSAGALVLVWWIGAFALVFGILLMIAGFRLRRLSHAFAEGLAHA